jgi:hypothetical protein
LQAPKQRFRAKITNNLNQRHPGEAGIHTDYPSAARPTFQQTRMDPGLRRDDERH